jgi:hypothetical protein
VEVFGKENFFCPLKVYKKYTKYVVRISFSAQKPVFRTHDGKYYTGKLFNEDMRNLLNSVIDYSKVGKISYHSFRIGIATMLGQLGYSDNEIMAIGRWSSSAFELYIRSPRAVRAKTAKRMAKELAQI